MNKKTQKLAATITDMNNILLFGSRSQSVSDGSSADDGLIFPNLRAAMLYLHSPYFLSDIHDFKIQIISQICAKCFKRDIRNSLKNYMYI